MFATLPRSRKLISNAGPMCHLEKVLPSPAGKCCIVLLARSLWIRSWGPRFGNCSSYTRTPIPKSLPIISSDTCAHSMRHYLDAAAASDADCKTHVESEIYAMLRLVDAALRQHSGKGIRARFCQGADRRC